MERKIPRDTFICFLIAAAIQESNTSSVGKHELMCALSQEVPRKKWSYYLHKISCSGWFVNIGRECHGVYTINPDKLEVIEAVAQRIANGDPIQPMATTYTQILQEPTKEKLLFSRLVRHGLHLSANGAVTVSAAEEMLRKEFSGENIRLHCPTLDREKKYELYEYTHCSLRLWSMTEDTMDKNLQGNEVDIRNTMRNPKHFQAMMSGDFKHGYDLSGPVEEQGILIWEVESKEDVHANAVKSRARNVSRIHFLLGLLIPLALKNSVGGRLSFEQILNFLGKHFNRFWNDSQLREIVRSICQPVRSPAQRLGWTLKEVPKISAQVELLAKEESFSDPNMDEANISYEDFLRYTMAVAIQESSTGSLGSIELKKTLWETPPHIKARHNHILSSSGWFINIGKACRKVWAIRAEKQSEIAAMAERIAKSDTSRFIGDGPKTDLVLPQHQLLTSKLVRHGLYISTHGFTVAGAQELLRKEFADNKVLLHCPLLDPERKYSLDDYTLQSTIIFGSMEANEVEQYLEQIASREDDFRKKLRRPNQFQNLLNGHFKHGYDLSSHTTSELCIWDVEEEVSIRPWKKFRPKPEPRIKTRLLVALAFKNSVSGVLSGRQINSFLRLHFHSLSKNLLTSTGLHLRFCDPSRNCLRVVQWRVKEMAATKGEDQTEIPVKREIINEDQMSLDRSEETNQQRPYPVDESWINEGDRVFYKHDIKIEEEEDLSPEGDSSPKRRRL